MNLLRGAFKRRLRPRDHQVNDQPAWSSTSSGRCPSTTGTTTDPVALRAMIGLLRERGARRVIVADMSGVQFVRFGKDHLSGSTRELMETAGMARAAREAGAEVHGFEEAGWDGFFAAASRTPDDFLDDREQGLPQERGWPDALDA